MTQFQLIALVLFLIVVAAAYKNELALAAKKLLQFKPKLPTSSADVAPSVAILLVNDIINVTELRDKLAAQGCREGVDACTTLLRVIVEFEPTAKPVNVA